MWKTHVTKFSETYAGTRAGYFPDDYLAVDRMIEFDDRVSNSLNEDQKARQNRLQNASGIPGRRKIEVFVFDRDPDVVAERLFQTNGKCGDCGRDAPFFRRTNNQPYLEVHHITPLSEEGRDKVENTIALCPNCHRKVHYGIVSPGD